MRPVYRVKCACSFLQDFKIGEVCPKSRFRSRHRFQFRDGGLAKFKEGLPFAALVEFSRESRLEMDGLCDAVIYSKLPRRRRQTLEPLCMDEADRLVRIAGAYLDATRIFGDKERATTWLTSPNDKLDGRQQLALLRSGAGNCVVKQFLR